MPFTISNQTYDNLLFRLGEGKGNHRVVSVLPFSVSAPCSLRVPLLVGRARDASSKELADDADWIAVNLAMVPGRIWERVAIKGDLPCTIYRNRISRKHHVLAVFPQRDTSCFLASIPDSVPLSSLMLPGTHETMSFYGWPISQCQSEPLDVQLHTGIRVIDIRLSIVDGRLIAHHGIFPEVTPFADILATLHNFLTSPVTASETVVVSIKQEDSDTQLFPTLVYNEIAVSPGGREMWFLEDRIPLLGQVRGKAIMFSRFGSDTGNGIHPTTWADSAKDGFQWECNGTLVRTQDWYNIGTFFSIPEKVSLATEILIPPPDSPTPTLSVSFLSASSVPLALPPVIALGFGWPKWGLGFKGANELVGKWLLDQLCSGGANCRRDPQNREHPAIDDLRIRGWLLMDYYQDPIAAGVVPLLVECNFRGRRVGEESRVDVRGFTGQDGEWRTVKRGDPSDPNCPWRFLNSNTT